jgi:hypothetical protein
MPVRQQVDVLLAARVSAGGRGKGFAREKYLQVYLRTAPRNNDVRSSRTRKSFRKNGSSAAIIVTG